MAEKDEAGIYYFQHGGKDGDEVAKENVYLRHLVEEQKKEIAELKKVIHAKGKNLSGR